MEIIKMEEKKAIKCPLCYGIQNKISIHSKRNIYESVAILNNYPTHCNEEKYCIGNAHIDLFQCVECGYIFNKSFSFDKIKNIYEQDNTYYQQKYFTNRLSQHILKIKDSILKYSKKSDIFLEIAPGQGDLLLALSKEAQICYSIDPSTLSDKYCICDNIIHVKSFFDKNIVHKLKHKINFIIFRHLLEHIDTPLTFLQDVVDLLEENGMIYIEVPNANDIFKFRRFIDLYHDHCGYYQKGVIANIMKKLNCELVEEVYYFEEQHMGLFFRKKISNNQKYFYSLYNNSLKHQIFNDIINFNTILKHYNTIALYGGGVQSHSLLNYIDMNNISKINKAFEINKEKVGKYMINSDIQIKFPTVEELKNIDLLIMTIPSHEKYAFENEITVFMNKNEYKGDILKMAHGIDLIKQY